MSRLVPQFLAAFIVLCGGAWSPMSAQDLPLERGTAITDPALLRKLDESDRLTVQRMLSPERASDVPLTTDVLFSSLPQLAQIRPAIDAEFERYVERQKASAPNRTVGVGEGFDVQLFDRMSLNSSDTRFVLAGIVNRMDRAYVSPTTCGEIRLIYRLIRLGTNPDGSSTASRLPMTLNLILKAKADDAIDGDGKPVTCADIARRWLTNENWLPLIEHGAHPQDRLLDRIETNMQIALMPKSARQDFQTDYLLKVFRYDADKKLFAEASLENQIDRDRILADDRLRREFREWLLDPEHLSEFDRGTVLVPDKFLGKVAIVSTPAGLDASPLQPEFGLMPEEGKTDPVFTENDVVSALSVAAERGISLQNIRSVAGFQRRLNDVTCAGCHQMRGIGGFHFPGVDWMTDKPSTIVPGSPHFFGDQVRRRDILTAFAAGNRPDFSRGFSDRPQPRTSQELAGTEYQDGWGAHCYLRAGSASPDKSFSSWTCARGLACQSAGSSIRIGMCFVQTR